MNTGITMTSTEFRPGKGVILSSMPSTKELNVAAV